MPYIELAPIYGMHSIDVKQQGGGVGVARTNSAGQQHSPYLQHARSTCIQDLITAYNSNRLQQKRSASVNEATFYLSPDMRDSRSSSPCFTLSPALRERKSFLKIKTSDSSKNLTAMDEKDNNDSCFKLARSMSYRQHKRSFVAKENSRGIAVSEIVLYLPYSELSRVRDAGEESLKRDEKMRQELLQNVLKNYDINHTLSRERQKLNQIEIENQSCESAFHDVSKDILRNGNSGNEGIESDFLNRKIIKNSDNTNLLTRAAEALSR